ncbi:hypothetical protein C0J50_13769 [Silurus asotus]|uniref:Chemokine interleukin-8-like domain-containing protein n=1 Tax=Silurus asotus TaxID=30991 RepID=A0AAD5B2T8_SILAS|nr:hypothetical protein C0J50_13769 [Silurus asotus]
MALLVFTEKLHAARAAKLLLSSSSKTFQQHSTQSTTRLSCQPSGASVFAEQLENGLLPTWKIAHTRYHSFRSNLGMLGGHIFVDECLSTKTLKPQQNRSAGHPSLCVNPESFTMVQNQYVQDSCCFRYRISRIPFRDITGYKVTGRQCANPGVISTLMYIFSLICSFTLKDSQQVCVDPELEWVQVGCT